MSKLKSSALALSIVGGAGLITCLLVFAFWLSDPGDMLRGNNPATMIFYTLAALLSGLALFVGLKRLRK